MNRSFRIVKRKDGRIVGKRTYPSLKKFNDYGVLNKEHGGKGESTLERYLRFWGHDEVECEELVEDEWELIPVELNERYE
jgi:hypothetical protein